MKKLMVIIRKDLRETLRTKAFYVSIAIVVFVVMTLSMGLGRMIETLIDEGTSSAEICAGAEAAICIAMSLRNSASPPVTSTTTPMRLPC